MRRRKIPMRKCIACQELKDKKELVRVVRTPEGEVKIDPSGKMSGRGAYICSTIECFESAVKKKAFDRALKTTVGADAYEQLQQQWQQIRSS